LCFLFLLFTLFIFFFILFSNYLFNTFFFFFFNDTATTEIYTLSLHDALPISTRRSAPPHPTPCTRSSTRSSRSDEHTSELQSRQYLVCRLLLETKKHHTL